MFRVITLLCLVITFTAALAQSPNTMPDRNEQVSQSNAIVVGVVEEILWVTRPDKRTQNTRRQPNGNVIVELQDPRDYVIGRVARLRVSEVVKQNGKVKVGNTVNIFLPGLFTTEGTPAIVEKQEFLAFLSKLKAKATDFAGTVLYKPGAPAGSGTLFMPRLNYVVVGDNRGAVRVTGKNRGVINEIKANVRNSRS